MIKICGIGCLFRHKTFKSKEDREEAFKIVSKLLIGLQNRGPDATGINSLKVGDTLFQANGIELNTVARYNIIGGFILKSYLLKILLIKTTISF